MSVSESCLTEDPAVARTSVYQRLLVSRLFHGSKSRPTARKSRVQPRIWAMLLAFVMGFIYTATIRPGHVWGDDFAMYILQAKHLCEGKWSSPAEYIYNPNLASLGPPAYPPVFPLLLAPIYQVFGIAIFAMKVEQSLFLSATLYLLFELFFPKIGLKTALLVIALCGASPFIWAAKDSITSDIPFCFFCILALNLIARNERTEWKSLYLSVSAGCLVYVCFATRTVGVALLPALIAMPLIKRKYIANSVWAGTLACSLIAAQLVLFRSHGSYIDQLHGMLQGVYHNVSAHGYNLGRLYLAGVGPSGSVFFAVFILLAAWGFAHQCRTCPGGVEVFFICYSVIILLWPTDTDPRFLLPLFLLAFMYVGVTFSQFKWKPARFAPTILGVWLSISYAMNYVYLDRTAAGGSNDPDFIRVCKFLAARKPNQSVTIFSKPRLLGLLSGRPASAYHEPVDQEELTKYMRQIRASYILQYEGFDSDRKYLARYLATHAGLVREVLRSGQYHLYSYSRS